MNIRTECEQCKELLWCYVIDVGLAYPYWLWFCSRQCQECWEEGAYTQRYDLWKNADTPFAENQ